MAMERGGRAAKIGNSYERLFAVRRALDVIAGELVSIQWEALGDDEHGVDLWVTAHTGSRTAYQAKRENASTGYWTVGALHEEGILANAQYQLNRDPTNHFRFVSSCNVQHVNDLADFSQRANDDPEAFYQHQVLSNAHRARAFRALLQHWSLDSESPNGRAHAFQMLQRLAFVVFDRQDRSLAEVRVVAAMLLDAEPATSIEVLGGVLDAHLGDILYVDQLRTLLAERGVHFRRLEGDPRVESGVRTLQNVFDTQLAEGLIAGVPIARAESDQLVSLLLAPQPPQIVFTVGDSGSGKSIVLHNAVRELRRANVPYLPVRLDSKRPSHSPLRFGVDVLSLPASPVSTLRALAGDRRAVLVLDQLDALRMTSVHSHSVWQTCRDLIEEALGHPNITVLLACRTFDLENDPLISSWRHSLSSRPTYSETIVKVAELPSEAVSALLQTIDINFTSMAPREQALLRSPGILALWWSMAISGSIPAEVASRTDLLRRFMIHKRRQAAIEGDLSDGSISDALAAFVHHMNGEGALTVHELVFPEHSKAVNAMCSVGLLHRDGRKLQFAHQSYFDHLLAESVARACLRDKLDPLDWILSDQSLFRRDQFRQLLELLRDASPPDHASLLSRLADDARIRFHVKHLLLGLLGKEVAPRDYELRFIEDLLNSPTLRENTFSSVLFGKIAWFDALDSKGQLARWLATWTDDAQLAALITFLRSVMSERGAAIDRLLSPYWQAGPAWAARLEKLATYDPADDCPSLFAERLRNIRSGRWTLHQFTLSSMAERTPDRLVPALDAFYAHWMNSLQTALTDANKAPPEWALEQVPPSESVHSVVRAHSITSFPLLSGSLRILHIFKQAAAPHGHASSRWWKLRSTLDEAIKTTQELLVSAIHGLTVDQPNATREMLEWPQHLVAGLEFAIIDGLIAGPDKHADNAIEWLLAHSYRFELGNGHDRLYWEPAVRLIRRFAPLCSRRRYADLEDAILRYHHDSERHGLERQLERLLAGYSGPSCWGRGQLHLLSALPPARISQLASERLTTWLAKFSDPANDLPLDGLGFCRVRSPVPDGPALGRLPDSEWLRIVKTDWPDEDRSLRVRRGKGFVESSVGQFSQDLSAAARCNPRRFASLALRMPPKSKPAFFARLLSAIEDVRPPDNSVEWQAASESEIEAIIQHVGLCSDPEYVMAVCRIVRSRRGAVWSGAIRDRILSWASHPHPDPNDFTVRSNSGPNGSMEPDIAATACNCVRGVVSEAIAQLCWDKPNWIPAMLPTIRTLLQDAHVSVRFEAAGICVPLLNFDRFLATELLIITCAHDDDRVLVSPGVHRAISYLRWSHFPEIEPVLLRMARSPIDKVAQEGCSWVTVCHLTQKVLASLAEETARGSLPQRMGVVDALLDCYPSLEPSAGVREALTAYFDDASEEVRNAAAQVFYRKDVFDQPDAPELARAFVQSRAFPENPEDLIRQLEDSSADLSRFSHVILAATDRVAGELSPQTRDFTTRMPFVGDDLSKLLFRLYEQSYRVNPELNKACLDRWDLMLQHRVGMTERYLTQLDM